MKNPETLPCSIEQLFNLPLPPPVVAPKVQPTLALTTSVPVKPLPKTTATVPDAAPVAKTVTLTTTAPVMQKAVENVSNSWDVKVMKKGIWTGWWAFIAGGGILAIIIGVTYYRHQNRKKRN